MLCGALVEYVDPSYNHKTLEEGMVSHSRRLRKIVGYAIEFKHL